LIFRFLRKVLKNDFGTLVLWLTRINKEEYLTALQNFSCKNNPYVNLVCITPHRTVREFDTGSYSKVKVN